MEDRGSAAGQEVGVVFSAAFLAAAFRGDTGMNRGPVPAPLNSSLAHDGTLAADDPGRLRAPRGR